LHYHNWVDTSVGVLLAPEGINHPVVIRWSVFRHWRGIEIFVVSKQSNSPSGICDLSLFWLSCFNL